MKEALVAQLKRTEKKRGEPYPSRAGATLKTARPVKAAQWVIGPLRNQINSKSNAASRALTQSLANADDLRGVPLAARWRRHAISVQFLGRLASRQSR
jgi:hypothetical protein